MRPLLVLASVWLLSSCGFLFDRLEGTKPGQIVGTARRDEANGKAASFARVGVIGSARVFRAERDGEFVVGGLPAGGYVLRFLDDEDGDSYVDRNAYRAVRLVKVTPPGTDEEELSRVLLGDVALTGTGTVRGHLTLPDGEPAAGARVVVFRT